MKMNKKSKAIINILIVLSFLSILFIPFISSPLPPPSIIGNLTITNISKSWNTISSTDSNYTIWIEERNKKKTNVCLLHKTETNPSQIPPRMNLYHANGSLIVELNTQVQNGMAGYCRLVDTEEYIRWGENPIVTIVIYQDVNLLEYKLDWVNFNVSLFKNISNTFDNSVNNIFVSSNNVSYKFGAIDNSSNSTNLERYLYQVESDKEIIPNNFKPYVFRTINRGLTNIQERHVIDFSDVCNKKFEPYNATEDLTNETFIAFNKTADCKFDYWNNAGHFFLNVTFTSNFDIDPVIQIDQFTSANSLNTNITQENNFTHLNISDIHPYNSLVAYYPFDPNHSNTNNITYDYSDNNNDGTVVNATINSSCMYGNCLDFDGFPDFVNVEVIREEITNNTDSITISTWVKLNSNTRFNFIFDIGQLSGTGIGLYKNSGATGTFVFYMPGTYGGNILNSGFSSDTEWHHVLGTWNGTNQSIYIDGIVRASATTPAFVLNSTSVGSFEALIGSQAKDDSQNVRYFNGTIDEVMFFNTSLTDQEVLDIYNNQSARFKNEGRQEFITTNIEQNGSFNRLNITTTTQQIQDSSMEVRLHEWNGTHYNDTIDGDNFDVGINDSMILWYHLDNRSGFENDSAVFDWSGRGNNGTTNGDAKPNGTGYFNGSFNFDGNADSINAGDHDAIGNITIAVWINSASPSETGFNNIVTKYNSGVTDGEWTFSLDTNNGVGGTDDLNWNCGGTQTNSVTQMKTGEWHFVALTMDESTNDVFIYTNNIKESFTNTDSCLINDTEGLGIGAEFDGGGGGFEGLIDEVMIWDRILSDAELKELYIRGRLSYDSPTAYQSIGVGIDNVTTFNISTDTYFVILEFNYSAGNISTPFYSPLLIGNVSIESFQAIVGEVDDPPVSILSRPANNTLFNVSNIITFEINATDDDALIDVNLTIYNSTGIFHSNFTDWNGTSNSTTFTLNITVTGIYLWNGLVTDNGSQSDWAVNRTINITNVTILDTTFPNVTINQPLNQTYTTNTIDFNITVLDETGVSFAFYTLNDGTFNYSMSNLTGNRMERN